MIAIGKKPTFHFLTPEYPPDKSGLAGYADSCSHGLATHGYTVHIWARTSKLIRSNPTHPNLHCHSLLDWSQSQLEQIAIQAGDISVLMFDPDRFENLNKSGLIPWLSRLKNLRCQSWLIVHRQPDPVNGLRHPFAWIQQQRLERYVSQLSWLSQRIFVATTARSALYKRWGIPEERLRWLPVPAYTAATSNPRLTEIRTKNLRKAFTHDSPMVIGTFASYQEPRFVKALIYVIPRILENHPERCWLALGRGSDLVVDRIRKIARHIAPQLVSSDEITRDALSIHFQTCDLMFQPYPAGVDASRTSTMMALAHSRPIVTTLGQHTEKVWLDSACVKLSPCDDFPKMTQDVLNLITQPETRLELSKRANDCYKQHFSIERCIERLLDSLAEHAIADLP